MSYKAILFDLDGTLIDTIDGITTAMNLALTELVGKTYREEDYKLFVGSGLDLLITKAYGKDVSLKQIEHCREMFSRNYAKVWQTKSTIYPGIKELLLGLKQKQISMSILSNKTHDFTVEMVKSFFPDIQFDVVLGARPEVRKKPHTDAVFEITNITGIKPSHYLYLGDTNVDMQTAKSAGMYALGATWGFRTALELLEHGANKLINNPIEILALL